MESLPIKPNMKLFCRNKKQHYPPPGTLRHNLSWISSIQKTFLHLHTLTGKSFESTKIFYLKNLAWLYQLICSYLSHGFKQLCYHTSIFAINTKSIIDMAFTISPGIPFYLKYKNKGRFFSKQVV